nr:uncharacterized protein LOC108078074 isoform X2 [Drosophila kikkawai]
MATRQSEAVVVDPLLTKRAKRILLIGSIVIYALWLLNIGLTAWNIRTYYMVLNVHRGCRQCFFASYMMITLGVECLTLVILFMTFPLVLYRMARGIRIYVTILFLFIFLEFMLALVLQQEYQAIGDVMLMWNYDKNLNFFEVNYQCCGVLGPGDYNVIGFSPPDSCYKDGSGKNEDLYTKGCSTVTVQPIPMSVCVIISLVAKRSKTPKRRWSILHPIIRLEARY